MRPRLESVAVLAVFAAGPLPAQGGPFSAQTWVEDVRVIARELPQRHPNLFYRLPHARWDSAVSATERRIPSLTRSQALVALMELIALARDGHTSIHPVFDSALGLRYYPVELYLFDDGLFIRSAAPAHRAIVGAKVVGIGRVSAEQALQEVARVISHENEWWVRAWGPTYLGFAELLEGLGLVDDPERLPLTIEHDGRRETVILQPWRRLEPSGHNPAAAFDRAGWIDMRGPAEPPLWLRQPGVPYWVEYRAAEQTLYVSYRAVVSTPHPPGNAAFWDQVFRMADSLPVERLVLDLRENIGGNSFYNRRVVRGIVARPRLDAPERLFVLTGGRTFSAAMNLARDLEKWTNATFVGEPTGNALHFFGDHAQVVLPVSGLAVNVSTLTWPPYDPRDRRDFLAPALYTPMTSAAYRANRDPALEAIQAIGLAPALTAQVETAVGRGDSAEAFRLVDAARRAPLNRFRSHEAEINALGYRLLNTRQVPAAITVFGINTRVFPGSANVWDSLGEAFILAGRREEGIAAYRRALAIDPTFGSSRQALARLGVAP